MYPDHFNIKVVVFMSLTFVLLWLHFYSRTTDKWGPCCLVHFILFNFVSVWNINKSSQKYSHGCSVKSQPNVWDNTARLAAPLQYSVKTDSWEETRWTTVECHWCLKYSCRHASCMWKTKAGGIGFYSCCGDSSWATHTHAIFPFLFFLLCVFSVSDRYKQKHNSKSSTSGISTCWLFLSVAL